MKKLGQKAGAIGALLFALIPAFFMAACSTDAAVDAAAVTAELKAEKAKYQTAVNLELEAKSVNAPVTGDVIKVVKGKADVSITPVIVYASSGQMGVTETKDLVIQSFADKTENDDIDDGKADAEAWRREAQVVTLQFEKDGITSYLDVLSAFGTKSTVTDTWLGYGYDSSTGEAKKPVLDPEKLKATGWIDAGSRESLRYTAPAALAVLAAQDFIDDVLSGMSTGNLNAVYGTDLITQAPAKPAALGNPGALLPLEELTDEVKGMYARYDDKDANRQVTADNSYWVSAVDIVVSSKSKSYNVKDQSWMDVSRRVTLDDYVWAGDMWSYKAVDFNTMAGGDYIYVVFQMTSDKSKAIEDFVIVYDTTKQQNEVRSDLLEKGYIKHWRTLNWSQSGPGIFLYYKPVDAAGTKSTKAVKWLGAVDTRDKITGKTPYQAVENSLFAVGLSERLKDAVVWVGDSPNPKGEHRDPKDANKNVFYSSYVYLMQQKADL